MNYWNKLPSVVRNSKSVDQFKVNLENFKRTKHNVVGNYWELSDEVLKRINDDNRRSHTELIDINIDLYITEHNVQNIKLSYIVLCVELSLMESISVPPRESRR